MAVIRKRRRVRGHRWEWSVRLKDYPHRHGACPMAECARECAKKAEQELKLGISAARITVAELIDLYEAKYLPGLPRSAASPGIERETRRCYQPRGQERRRHSLWSRTFRRGGE